MKLTFQLIDNAGNIFRGEAILESVSENGKKRVFRQSNADEPISGKIKCPFAIERLWQNGKFKEALSFNDIKTSLGEEGYNFPKNTLMMALKNMTFLTRHGSRGNYSWAQKYPFNN